VAHLHEFKPGVNSASSACHWQLGLQLGLLSNDDMGMNWA